ncbi:MAG: CPBP family intramembrane metalloprotease [Bacteroidales bacterium]|nr:CPBP family intramembrane metalloprotease [Bacteroidales bacterium]
MRIKDFFNDIKPSGQLLALALIFVLFFILAVGVSVAIGFMIDGVAAKMTMQVVTQVITFAGTAFFFAYLFYDKPLRCLGLNSTHAIVVKLLMASLILVALLPVSDWLTRMNDSWHLPQSLASFEESMRSMGEKAQAELEVFLNRTSVGALIGNLFVLAFVPAICEELLFRGALQRLFCRMLSNHHVAIWITAALFSLFHGELFAFLPRFVLGAALGYLFYYSSSIWINVMAHFLNNALAVVLFYLACNGYIDTGFTESLNAPWYLALLGLVVAIILFLLFFARNKTDREI